MMPSLIELPVSTPTVATPTGKRAVPASVYLPIGLANPIWFAFTAAAGAGAAFWMMTRFVKPMNLEALAGAFAPPKIDPQKVGQVVETAARPAVEAAGVIDEAVEPVAQDVQSEPVAEAAARPVAETSRPLPDAAYQPSLQPMIETAVEAFADTAEAATHLTAQATDAAIHATDDLTRLIGVGPRTAAALASRGVTRFSDLASWTQGQLADFDAELGLRGRSLREDWIEQARALARQS
jgi:predicted flap endonuclease-1-like 5' DNA nuclease